MLYVVFGEILEIPQQKCLYTGKYKMYTLKVILHKCEVMKKKSPKGHC